ncbi:MAG: hypothetical protein ACJA1C_000498 [Crocinitomicaceae bacterium]|jgi:hypothetical protein
MKKVFLALSLTLFVGTVAMANYSSTDNTAKTEVEKEKKEKKKKKSKKAKKGKKKCASSSCCSKTAA